MGISIEMNCDFCEDDHIKIFNDSQREDASFRLTYTTIERHVTFFNNGRLLPIRRGDQVLYVCDVCMREKILTLKKRRI